MQNPPSKSANTVVIFCSTMVTRAGFSLFSHVKSLRLGKAKPMVRKSQILSSRGKQEDQMVTEDECFWVKSVKRGHFSFLTCVWHVLVQVCYKIWSVQPPDCNTKRRRRKVALNSHVWGLNGAKHSRPHALFCHIKFQVYVAEVKVRTSSVMRGK